MGARQETVIERGLKRGTQGMPLVYSGLSVGKRLLFTVLGFFRYHLQPRKSIVMVYSSMRTGSTLVKSLIGEASDVSLVDEFNFLPYIEQNDYLFYGLVCSLAPEPVVLLKKPYNNNPEHLPLYGLSPMPGVRKIILYRDPYDTLCSLRALQVRREKRRFSDEELVDYWCDCYRHLLQNTRGEDVLVVKYEDLTTQPREVTARIFSFVGSQQSEGVDSYSEYNWVGGRDDVSDRIKGLTVEPARHNSPEENPGLHALLRSDPRVAELERELQQAASLER